MLAEIPRKEAPEENCISASKGVSGLEERIAIMRKRSIVNQVVDDQERDDQNTVAAAKGMEVAAPPVAEVAAPEQDKEIQNSKTTSWKDTAALKRTLLISLSRMTITSAKADNELSLI